VIIERGFHHYFRLQELCKDITMARTYATSAAVIVISILFPVIGTAVVSLRFYIRANAKTRPWIDDWLTVPALVGTLSRSSRHQAH